MSITEVTRSVKQTPNRTCPNHRRSPTSFLRSGTSIVLEVHVGPTRHTDSRESKYPSTRSLRMEEPASERISPAKQTILSPRPAIRLPQTPPEGLQPTPDPLSILPDIAQARELGSLAVVFKQIGILQQRRSNRLRCTICLHPTCSLPLYPWPCRFEPTYK